MGRKNKASAASGASAGMVMHKRLKYDTVTDADFEEAPKRATSKRAASPSSGSEPDVAVEQRRVSPRWLVEALKLLNDRQLRVVEEMGFGQLIHLQVEAVPGKLVHWCLERFQPRSCSLRVPNKEQLHIDADDVFHIFGFPKGPLRIDKKCSSNDKEIEEEWVERIGKQKHKILPSDVVAAMMAGREGGDWFCRHFLILVESCLFESAVDGYIKPKIMDILRDLTQIRHHNWCEHMITVLQRSHERWLANKTNKFTGPSVFIALLYVDRMVHRQREVARGFPLLKGWTSVALRMRQRAELENNGFGSGFVDKRFMVEDGHMIEESTHGNGRAVLTLSGGQGYSRGGLSEPVLYTRNLIKAAKQVADAMSGLLTKLVDAPLHIRQAPNYIKAVQATCALVGVKCKEETAQSSHVVGCSQTLMVEVRGTMGWEHGIERVLEVIEERDRLEEYFGYPSYSLGITEAVKESQPDCSLIEKEGVMDEDDVSKSVAELEDLGSPIYILGQEGEVLPWIEQGKELTPRVVPPLDCTTNEVDNGSESDGQASATICGERLSCTKVSLAEQSAPVFYKAAGANVDFATGVKSKKVVHILDEPGETKLVRQQIGEASSGPPDTSGAQLLEGERTDYGEVQNNAAGIIETVEDIVNVLNMYPEMLGELHSVEGNNNCQATVIANAPCAPAVLDNEEFDDEPVGATIKRVESSKAKGQRNESVATAERGAVQASGSLKKAVVPQRKDKGNLQVDKAKGPGHCMSNRSVSELTKASNMFAPINERAVKVTEKLTSEDKEMFQWVVAYSEGGENDIVFSDQDNVIAMMADIKSLKPHTFLTDGVVNAWTSHLNNQERLRARDSPSRFFFTIFPCSCNVVDTPSEWGPDMVREVFFSRIEAEMEVVQDFKIGRYDMFFFPICLAHHFIVVVLDLKQRRVVLLDNASARDDEPITVMYDDIPSSVAKYFCEWMMANNNHEKGKMMINQPIMRLALPWRDEENKVDCGVYAMRHMETYMGQSVCDWKIGLSGLAAKAIHNLRIKYVKTLLVSEANDLCKDNIARVQAWFKCNRHVHFDKFVGMLNRSNR